MGNLPFSAATRAWFEGAFQQPTRVQREGWERIARGEHTLLLAPTGSGKTLAAFLAAIDRLSRRDPAGATGTRVLYVSPLKALIYDVERNLRAPLVGVRQAAERLGEPFREPTVSVRTGDTSQRDRRAQLKTPGDILITTPESLYLLLGSAARETLRTVETVIVDEVHAVAASKRGVHLALSLERLARLCERDPQRIGLSATVHPVTEVSRYLGGADREVQLVDTSQAPSLDLEVVVPLEELDRPPLTPPESGPLLSLGDQPSGNPTAPGIWATLHPELLAQIQAHRSTILFVNSRVLCERLAAALNELAGEDLVRAHHGSLAHRQRREVEEALKAGRVRGLVATSSLELGIDMGAVDLVIQVASPGSTASGLQRVGRAGHGVGQVSKGRLYPKFRGDLLESAVVAAQMRQGRIEALRVPRRCLDVLAQQVVSMVGVEPWAVAELERVVRRAYPYQELSRDVLHSVLDMLTGRYPSDAFADLRPALNWDRQTDRLEPRRHAKMLAALNGGTIPDRGLYRVVLGHDGPRVGELDEEMVFESRQGETFVLGASTWRILEIDRDRVVVEPAPGEPGKLPFWRGEGPGRPLELGRALGAFVAEVGAREPADAERWVQEHAPVDALAARNLVAYLREQRESTGTLPTDRALTIERFRDELGDWRVCILTPFGSRVHAPWALALEAELSEGAGFDVRALWSDDGIALRFADAEAPPDPDQLIPSADLVEDQVIAQLRHAPLFQARFRENAARALLLPRRNPRARTPLWAQRLRAERLHAAASRFPSFPVILETYRECLQDVFDLPALVEVLRGIERRELIVEAVDTQRPSPFARGLSFAYVSAYMYQMEAPLAERRAQALTLDRELLRDLLGEGELRELLDPLVLEQVEAELQALAADRRARHADGLHDVLRRLGDLSQDEVTARVDGDAEGWLRELEAARRVLAVRVAGEPRWIAVEDAGRYRDALGVVPPAGLPDVFLEPVPGALAGLLLRWARTHAPFTTGEVAARYGLTAGQLEPVLQALEGRSELLRGELRPGGSEPEWCDPEVLRRLRRRTLARLRREVAPVEASVLARFLPAWQGVGERGGATRLLEVVQQLEGLALPVSSLEGELLPARVPGYQPRLLDELGARGELVWVGRGALGAKDGKVVLCTRSQVGLLLDPPEVYDAPSALHTRILEHLEQRGACFEVELAIGCGRPPQAELSAAIQDLMWAGQITNDTFAPLRQARTVRRVRGARRRGGGPGGGRWSRVQDLALWDEAPTQRAHARALLLLERHGVVSRESVAAEAIPGGFAGIYPVLQALEEAGKVRRGYFIEGLGAAQFALPGAVERLRAARQAEPGALWLAAVDPAQPYGGVLPWPETPATAGRPRRVVGARVLLVEGQPALYLERGGKSLLTFPALADTRARDQAVEALQAAVAGRRSLRLERIDGESARESAHAVWLLAGGFVPDYRGLSLPSS